VRVHTVLDTPCPLAPQPTQRPPRAWRLLGGAAALILVTLATVPLQAATIAAEPVPGHQPAPAHAAKKSAPSKPADAPAPSGKAAAAGPHQGHKQGSTHSTKTAAPAPAATRPPAQNPVDAARAQAHTAAFEQGPGVLGVSLNTLRRDQLKDYVSEPVGLVALGLDDLRFTPVNKKDRVEVNLADRIPFEGTGDKVGAKAKPTLDALGRLLVANPRTRVQVLVHTDDQGDAGYNLRQSQRAAEAVKEYLVARGVAAERLTAVGRGEEAPLAATGKRTPTARERWRNQRVELIVEPFGEPLVPPPIEPPVQAPTQPAAAPQDVTPAPAQIYRGKP
jgi:outer membrane protein OmpA-like peptidoglycan-associated protein